MLIWMFMYVYRTHPAPYTVRSWCLSFNFWPVNFSTCRVYRILKALSLITDIFCGHYRSSAVIRQPWPADVLVPHDLCLTLCLSQQVLSMEMKHKSDLAWPKFQLVIFILHYTHIKHFNYNVWSNNNILEVIFAWANTTPHIRKRKNRVYY